MQLGISLAVSAIFLWLALRGEDWSEISAGLADARYEYLLLMGVVGVYALFVRAQRWRLLLITATGQPMPLHPIFSACAIGFMANMVLPFRVGEFVRPYLASRSTGVSLSTSLATAVVERVLDLLALVAMGLWVIMNAEVPDVVRQLTQLAAVLMVVAVGGILVVNRHRDTVLPLLDKVWAKLPASIGEVLTRLEHEFLDGMAVIANPAVFIQAAAWSLYIWLLIALGFALGFPAVGIDVELIAGGITTATIVALVVSVPGAPGFVGQFEYGCKLALVQVFGVPGALAVGFALVTHAAQFATQVLLGLVYLLREGLSLGELGHLKDDVDVT
jgi:uncharacterized protein (TIRG00374 family)